MQRSRMGQLSTLLIVSTVCGVAQAQVVQLPTFRQFSVSTSVSVPDRGGAYLGGVSRAANSRVSNGRPIFGKVPVVGRLGQNRGISSIAGASHSSVHATIIDFNELDPALNRRQESIDPRTARADWIVANVARNQKVAAVGRSLPTPEKIRARNAQAVARRAVEARDFYRRGTVAERAGKADVAKIYYRMANRRAIGSLQAKSLAAMRRVEEIPSVANRKR